MAKTGQAVTKLFTTTNPATGAAANAASTPVGTLYVNGTANGATVTVTNITTGLYKAAVTLPALSAGDILDLNIAATVASVSDNGIVWSDIADTKYVSEVPTPPTVSAIATEVWNTPQSVLTTAGSIGKRISDFVTSLVYAAPPAAAPTVGQIVDGVWDEALDGSHLGTETFGWYVFNLMYELGRVRDAVLHVTSGAAATYAYLVDKLTTNGVKVDPASKTGYTLTAAGATLSAASLTSVGGQVTTALNTYDPPKSSEATADKQAILDAVAAIPLAVEGRMLNEADGQALLNAIVTAINTADVDVAGLSVTAIATEVLNRLLVTPANKLATDAAGRVTPDQVTPATNVSLLATEANATANRDTVTAAIASKPVTPATDVSLLATEVNATANRNTVTTAIANKPVTPATDVSALATQVTATSIRDFLEADVSVDAVAKTITWKQKDTHAILLVKPYEDRGSLQSIG